MKPRQKILNKYLVAIAQPLNRHRWISSSLAVLLCTLGYGVRSVQAEGSRTLYPSTATGFRANTEWATNTYGPASNSLLRRTLLKVYANAGEYILVGSSAVGVGSGDILIYNPNRVTGRIGSETIPTTSDFSCNTQRGTTARGRITSRVLELAGPQSVTGGGNPTGYLPCSYIAPSTGVYDVVIYGTSGNNFASTGTPTGEIDLINAGNFTAANQGTSISAWDVTVRNNATSTTDINGRLFTYYLSLFTGGNGRPINSSVFPVTTDGYRYRTDLRGLDPNGFVVYGNQRGFLDSDGQTPLYHDVLGDSAQINNLQGGTNLALPQYPLFFNQADTTVVSSLSIPLIPILPSLTNPVFSGTVSGNNSVQNTGGTFAFSNNVTGSYILVISRDGLNFDPTNPNNRLLRGSLTTTGSQSISWDGRDNSGTFFPVGQNYQVRLRLTAGEYHFPLLDAENSTQGGPTFNLLNATNPLGNSVGFYDDRGYRTIGGTAVGTIGNVLCGLNPPATPNSDFFTGFDSGTTQRAFGSSPGSNTNASCTGSFGDAKGLDVWTYFPSNTASVAFNIVAPDLTITKTHTGNFTKGGSGTYTLTATNSGTDVTTGTVTVSDTLPTGLTPTAATGTGWTCTISGQVVTCTRSDALAANTSYPPITLTVNVAPTAPASITNTATISGGGQTNTTNDSVNDATTINPSADLSLTKIVNNASPDVGGNVTFTVTVSNAGPDAATGVSVADALPPGLTFVSFTASQGTYNNTTGVWSVGSVASATNATLQITATVATAGAKTNTAQVSASGQQDPDSTPNNSVATEDDQASATVTPSSTDLSIVKTDSPDPAIAGNNLTYAIAVTNTGSPATNVVMSDPLPSGTTFQSITSPAGWTCTTPAVGSGGTVSCTSASLAVGTSNFTVVVRVAPSTANNSTLSNTATVSSATSDTNTNNNSSTQSTTIQQSADLRLTKVATPASPAVGATFNYTITVTNDGPSIATNVRVRDALPLGIGYVLNTPSQGTYDPLGTQVWNVGTLNPGASATLTIQAIRTNAASTVNTAEVIGADQNDPDSPHNNQVVGEDDQDSVTVPNQAVDLAVTKTVNNATPSVGQNVTFTISVTNSAASTITATNVGITDVLPQGLTYQSHTTSTGTYNSNTGVWSIASLTPGTTANLTLVAQVTTSGAKTNTAQLSTLDQADPNTNNNSGSAIVTVAAVPPNLLLVKRITEVSGTPTSGFDDLLAGSKAGDDNNANWPTPLATYLRGLLNGGSINPGERVEYTIYFLNNQNPATNVTICDPIPANMTFVTDGYNSASPRPTDPGALPTDTGIALGFNASTLPIDPTVYLTNANDSDRGRYYPPNDPSTPAACKRVNASGSITATGAAANTDGAIVVNVVSGTDQLPSATASGTPRNSYGFVRFKARVK